MIAMLMAIALCGCADDTGLTAEEKETLRREGASEGLIDELDCVCEFLDDMQTIRRKRNKDIYDGLPQDPRSQWPLHDHDGARAPGVAFKQLEMLAPHSDPDADDSPAPAPAPAPDTEEDRYWVEWDKQNKLLFNQWITQLLVLGCLGCLSMILGSLLWRK